MRLILGVTSALSSKSTSYGTSYRYPERRRAETYRPWRGPSVIGVIKQLARRGPNCC